MLINYRAGSCDYFKPICSPRPYVSGFKIFVKNYMYSHTNLNNARLNTTLNADLAITL